MNLPVGFMLEGSMFIEPFLNMGPRATNPYTISAWASTEGFSDNLKMAYLLRYAYVHLLSVQMQPLWYSPLRHRFAADTKVDPTLPDRHVLVSRSSDLSPVDGV